MKNNYSQQRELVYEVLSNTTSHPTAEWIYEQCRLNNPSISKGTVYRNLALLKSKGEIIEVSGMFESARYDARVEKHNHVVCVKCGRVMDSFPSEELKNAVNNEMNKNGYFDYGLTFYGVCEDCKNKK